MKQMNDIKKITADQIRTWDTATQGKITMITAYDAADARIAAISDMDILLIGDSLGSVKLGLKDVKEVTAAHISHHTSAVRRGAPNHFIVSDVPFITMQKDTPRLIDDCKEFIQSGADAVKMESDLYSVDKVKAVLDAGVEVIGHLGYTPQTADDIGQSTVQGKTADKALALLRTADALEKAGCFCLLCELIPGKVGQLIANRVQVPVIGIGAGVDVNGQVLVIHDLLGFSDKDFKFLRRFGELGKAAQSAISEYTKAVREGTFPSKAESFLMKTDEWRTLRDILESEGLI